MRVHRTDLVSFAFGLLFVALAAWWLLAQLLGLVLPPVGWFLAGGLILIGGLGLIGALSSNRYAAKPQPPAPAEPDPASRQPSAPVEPDPTGPETVGPVEPEPWATSGPETPEPGSSSWSVATEPEPTDVEPRATSQPGAERTLDLSTGDEAPPGQRGSAS